MPQSSSGSVGQTPEVFDVGDVVAGAQRMTLAISSLRQVVR